MVETLDPRCQQTSKPRLWPVILLFASAPFSDKKHERNAVQERIFPNLRRLCEPNGFQFQATDLPKGMPTEAGLKPWRFGKVQMDRELSRYLPPRTELNEN